MHRAEHTWWSPAVRRPMSLAEWGDRGMPVLLFPTGGGDFLECERFLMIKVLTPLIEAGRLHLFACGTISRDGWLNPDATMAFKTFLQARFDDYIANEVVPFVRERNGDPSVRLGCVGQSLGAYNAVNSATKHPELFRLTITMSGTFDLSGWVNGDANGEFYFNNPPWFVPNLSNGPQLEWLRRSYFHLAVGRGTAEVPHRSWAMGQILGSKGIPNWVDIWDEEAGHNWVTWRRMLPDFLDRFVP